MTSLSNTLPELRDAYDKLTQLAQAQGITFKLNDYGGYRTQSDTTQILKYRDDDYDAYVKALKARDPNATPVSKYKFRPIAPYGASFHDFGAAFDISPVTWPASMGGRSVALAAIGALAPQAGLKWGHAFGDDPHFQLAIAIDDAKQRWAAFQAAQPKGSASLVGIGVAVVIGGVLWWARRHAMGGK